MEKKYVDQIVNYMCFLEPESDEERLNHELLDKDHVELRQFTVEFFKNLDEETRKDMVTDRTEENYCDLICDATKLFNENMWDIAGLMKSNYKITKELLEQWEKNEEIHVDFSLQYIHHKLTEFNNKVSFMCDNMVGKGYNEDDDDNQ